jgi:hypothetical protein
MQAQSALLTGLFLVAGIHIGNSSAADRIDLSTEITLSGSEPPPDSLAVYDSAVNITGLAGMPDLVAVRIPRADGVLTASVRMERMDRREGFGERDFWRACAAIRQVARSFRILDFLQNCSLTRGSAKATAMTCD